MAILKAEKITSGKVGVEFSLGDTRKATSRCFAKLVKKVIIDKSGGFAFKGKLIKSGAVVDAPAFIALVRGEGSWKHKHSHFYLFKVEEHGATELYEGPWDTDADKMKAVLAAAKLVNGETGPDTTKEDAPVARNFLKKGMVVRARLPSKSLLTKRLPEIFRDCRVGDKEIRLITGYFANKLGHLAAKFYRKVSSDCILIPIEENKYMYVVPPDRVLEFYQWVKEFKREYEQYEEDLRNFLKKGEIPQGVRSNAKFDYEYLQTVQEYLTRQGVEASINVPDIADRVDIRFEEFHLGDKLFQVFAEEKYEHLLKELSEKEKELLEELNQEIQRREQELMKNAYASVKEKVDNVIRDIDKAVKAGPTKQRIRNLKAALEAAEQLAQSIGMHDIDFSKPRAILEEAEKESEKRDYREVVVKKPRKRRQKSAQKALVEALAQFATA